MKVEPSGIVTVGECELRLPHCLALTPAPVMAICVSSDANPLACRSCLEEMVRHGEWELPGAKISRLYDLAVYGKNEKLQLVVDVKDCRYNHEEDSAQWATRIRRNLVRHSGIPTYVYFLLAVYPTPFFLWGADEASEAAPHYHFDVQPEMPRLYESKTASDYQQQVDAVALWLESLLDDTAKVPSDADWLYSSGLWTAIEGGTIVKRPERAEMRQLQAT